MNRFRRKTALPILAELDNANSFGDIFALVKDAVKHSLGLHRVGLMLYLGNLPIRVGAFHPIGTNDIVLNRRLFKTDKDRRQKAHIFTILLHEYLHSLGFRDEREVRRLVYQICRENFDRGNPVIESAISGPWKDLTKEDYEELELDLELELIRDFERIDMEYII